MQTGFQGSVATFAPTDKGAEIDFSGCGHDDVAQLLGAFFQTSGFKLERGSPTDGTYGSGSSVGRLAAGGWAARKKYVVAITSANGSVHASVSSAMSGMGGGVLGVVKERKQRGQFVDSLRAYIA